MRTRCANPRQPIERDTEHDGGDDDEGEGDAPVPEHPAGGETDDDRGQPDVEAAVDVEPRAVAVVRATGDETDHDPAHDQTEQERCRRAEHAAQIAGLVVAAPPDGGEGDDDGDVEPERGDGPSDR